MRQVFSPRQVARAIGASESSVKRWCDRGVLPSIKTAGGHRRLPIAGILEFVRSEKHSLADPTELGLPAGTGAMGTTLDAAVDDLKKSLLDGAYPEVRRIMIDLFLAQHPISAIFDSVVATALHQIGDDWCDGTVQVFEERRGCELTSQILYELRSMMPLPSTDAPVAMGGSGENDLYAMPTRMVELTLIENGWNAMSLGTSIPINSLRTAIETHRPRLFWLSCSHISNEEKFLVDYDNLQKACGSKTALVVGGRALTPALRERMQYTTHCENLQRLASFAQALHPSA